MAEAHLLRGEYEDRNRRLHDQLFPGGSMLGNILRQSGNYLYDAADGGLAMYTRLLKSLSLSLSLVHRLQRQPTIQLSAPA